MLNTRIDEHKAAVKHGKLDVSAVAEHAWKDGHEIDFQCVSVLAQDPNLQQRVVLEYWCIKTLQTITREKSVLDTNYNSLFFPRLFSIFKLYTYIFIFIYFFIFYFIYLYFLCYSYFLF